MQTIHEIKLAKHFHIHEEFLKTLLKSNILTHIYLKNGIKLRGYIKAFDELTIILEDQVSLLIFQTNIATIMPALELNDGTVRKKGELFRRKLTPISKPGGAMNKSHCLS